MESIDQRWLQQQRRAECLAEGVKFSYRSPFVRQEYRVRYEDILAEPIEFTDQSSSPPILESIVLTAGLVFAGVAFVEHDRDARLAAAGMMLLLSCISASIWLFKRWPRPQILQLSSGDPALLLFVDRPTPAAVTDFLATLRSRRDDFLRANYGSSSPGGSPLGSKVDQIERLHRLRLAGAVSEQEYETLKAEIVGPEATHQPSGQYL